MSIPSPAPGRSPWEGLSHDPRLPEHAHLRAAHQDREAVAQVLAEAYADGRLTREEHDERCATLAASKTLGELPPLVADLVWAAPPSRAAALPAAATSPGSRARAESRYAAARSQAWWTTVWFTLLATGIWLIGALGEEDGSLEVDPYFFWPAFVLLVTGWHYGTLVLRRRQWIEEEAARLERKAAKQRLKRQRRRRELPGD